MATLSVKYAGARETPMDGLLILILHGFLVIKSSLILISGGIMINLVLDSFSWFYLYRMNASYGCVDRKGALCTHNVYEVLELVGKPILRVSVS